MARFGFQEHVLILQAGCRLLGVATRADRDPPQPRDAAKHGELVRVRLAAAAGDRPARLQQGQLVVEQ